MRFYDNLFKNINIAILEGIVTFGNNEGRFCREISFYYDSFKKTEDALKKNKIIIQYSALTIMYNFLYDAPQFITHGFKLYNWRRKLNERKR